MSIYYLKNNSSKHLFIVNLNKKTLQTIDLVNPEFSETSKQSKDNLQKNFIENSKSILKKYDLTKYLPALQLSLFDPQQEIFPKYQYQNH